jgi:protein AbiQ
MDIRFYYVDTKYIDYLKQYEISHRGFTCVPNVTYANRSKFVYGAVLEINGISYFVPVSSKIKKDQYSMLIKTKDKVNPVKGSLRFRYMIPIPHCCLVPLDIKTMIESGRQRLVMNELAACRKNRDAIFKHAMRTYSDVITYTTPALKNNSCDFLLLEKAYHEYLSEQEKVLSEIT